MGNATSALPIDQETGDVSLYRYYWKKRKQKQRLSQNNFLELLAMVDLIVEEEMRLTVFGDYGRRNGRYGPGLRQCDRNTSETRSTR